MWRVGPRKLDSPRVALRWMLDRLRYGRMMAVQKAEVIMSTGIRKRDQRLEVRTTLEERALINQAVSSLGTDLTAFAVSSLLEASRRVLADRQEFAMDAPAASEWERINNAPAEALPGLLRLMARPSPFADEV